MLYEMLTAQRLFRGEDFSETLASVIKEEPTFERAPAKVRRLVRGCLKKDPKQRLQAIGDWRFLLDDEQAPPEKIRSTKTPWIAAGALAAALDQRSLNRNTFQLPGRGMPELLKQRACRRLHRRGTCAG